MSGFMESWMIAKLQIKPEKMQDFVAYAARLVPIMQERLGWALVGALADPERADTIVHVWRIPDPSSVASEEEKLGELSLYREAMECVEHEEVKIFTTLPYHVPTTSSGYVTYDDDILIAADDGGIYKITEREWHQERHRLCPEVEREIKNHYLKVGVALADIPEEHHGPFGAICYLLNLTMVRPKSTGWRRTSEPGEQ